MVKYGNIIQKNLNKIVIDGVICTEENWLERVKLKRYSEADDLPASNGVTNRGS